MKQIYLDNAAATRPDKKVLQAMEKVARFHYANPSSFNEAGRLARKELDKARLVIARFLKAKENEIIFTSSGSEANSLALLGFAAQYPDKKRIIISPIEHTSILKAAEELKKRGYVIDMLEVDEVGRVRPESLKKKLSKDVLAVSVMAANNEIGTIQPIVEIGKIIEHFHKTSGQHFPTFHVDACQAAGNVNISPNRLRAHLVTFNSSKIYGPKGAAVLYVRNGTRVYPLVFGGGQEGGARAGTENLPAIVGMTQAVSSLSLKNTQKISLLRDLLIKGIEKAFPGTRLNGPRGKERLANNVNVSFLGLESEAILVELDKYGIYAGSGSACTSRSVEPSHVLKAINVPATYLDGAVRFSLSKDTTKKDIEYVIKTLQKVIGTLKQRYRKTIEKR